MIDLNVVRKRARALTPILQIGKKGLSDGLIKEIRVQLKKNKVIKIRILKSAKDKLGKGALVKDIVSRADAVLVDVMGSTMILLKKGDK